jgi:hypothetical protein
VNDKRFIRFKSREYDGINVYLNVDNITCLDLNGTTLTVTVNSDTKHTLELTRSDLAKLSNILDEVSFSEIVYFQ